MAQIFMARMTINRLTILFLLTIGVLIAAGIYFFAKPADPFKHLTNYPAKGNVVVAFGDSLTAGYGATKGNDYVSQLSKKLDLPIINKGKSSDTTAKALQRIGDVTALNPNVVIVYLGGNDFLQKVSPDITFANIEKIVARLQEKGALVILVGIRGGLLSDQYEAHFKDVADRYNTLYIPDMLLTIMGMKDHMYDAIHPNDAGYAVMADTMYTVTKDLFATLPRSK